MRASIIERLAELASAYGRLSVFILYTCVWRIRLSRGLEELEETARSGSLDNAVQIERIFSRRSPPAKMGIEEMQFGNRNREVARCGAAYSIKFK